MQSYPSWVHLSQMAHSVNSLEMAIPLTDDTAKDVNWWLQFASQWNGIAFFLDTRHGPLQTNSSYSQMQQATLAMELTGMANASASLGHRTSPWPF